MKTPPGARSLAVALVAASLALSGAVQGHEISRPRLVKDINPGTKSSVVPHLAGLAEDDRRFATLGNKAFFWAFEPGSGWELWKSDGTRAGTSRVRDIRPGKRSSLLWTGGPIVRSGRRLFFVADDGRHGAELWTSDGTRKGTKLVKNMNRSPRDSNYHWLTDVNGTLYFNGGPADTGGELWRSNGTKVGTVLVRDIYPGRTGSEPTEMTEINGTVYFTAQHPEYGRELWKSDGTRSGTVLVKDINPGPGWSYPEGFAKVGSTLYFSASHEEGNGPRGEQLWKNTELWKSDGTAEGTILVKDINPGPLDSSPNGLTKVGRMLFFTAWDPNFGRELWKSDGTLGGTTLVKDIDPYPDRCVQGCRQWLYGLTNVDGTLFFAAVDPVGFELWKSDGSLAGTVMVKNIYPDPGGSDPSELVNIGRTLYFSADDGTSGHELWRSRGTARATKQLADINPGGAASYPFGFTKLGDRLFFVAEDGRHGWEPYSWRLRQP